MGDFDLIGGDLKLEVLNELDSSAEVIIVAEGLAVLFGVLNEMLVGLTSRHVVGFDAVDFGDFVHQQFLCY
jgi:hypothetical protein